ncbi:MAG: hypothetical protein ACFCUJ_12830 [Thiotrichales bacterium]
MLWALVLLAGCSSEPDSGPGAIRWDREVCERCVMAVSDRHYAAQVRGGPAGQKTRLYKFDDIGCATLWLEDQSWVDDPRTEIWVTDYQTGKWLDARSAWFIEGRRTPMDYGLGAQSDYVAGALDFDAARLRIREVEAHFHSIDTGPPSGVTSSE